MSFPVAVATPKSAVALLTEDLPPLPPSPTTHSQETACLQRVGLVLGPLGSSCNAQHKTIIAINLPWQCPVLGSSSLLVSWTLHLIGQEDDSALVGVWICKVFWLSDKITPARRTGF